MVHICFIASSVYEDADTKEVSKQYLESQKSPVPLDGRAKWTNLEKGPSHQVIWLAYYIISACI